MKLFQCHAISHSSNSIYGVGFLLHIVKTITCAGCKETIPYGKPFAYYDQSAYCSKKCCVDHIWDGDNNRLFEVSSDKSLEEYDREFLRYHSYE